jgi:hypothetical protein
MSKEFEMSMVGELTYFLGFQVKQMKDGNFLSQDKYTKYLLKRSNMEKCKSIKTPMPTNGHLDLDEGGNPVDQTCWGEGEDATRRVKPPSRRYNDETRDDWRGCPSSSPLQDEGQTPTKSAGPVPLILSTGPCGIRPTAMGPAWTCRLRASSVIAFL